MKIHVVHSNAYDFKNELYLPLRNSELNKQNQIFLPHETDEFIKTKDLIKDADAFNRPIICMFKSGNKISGSLKAVSEVFVEYDNSDDLVLKLSNELTNFKEA